MAEAGEAGPQTRKNWKVGCHLARDMYYKCFTEISPSSPPSDCDSELAAMFRECPQSWAKFYKGKALRLRHDETMDSVVENYNRKLNEGLDREGNVGDG